MEQEQTTPDSATKELKKSNKSTYIIIGVGILGLYIAYKSYSASKSSSSGSGVVSVPIPNTGTVVGNGGGVTGISGLQGAISGAITSALQGSNTAPNLSVPANNTVTPTSTTTVSPTPSWTPTPISQGLFSKMSANGEHIVQTIQSPNHGTIYLTNKGGIYNTGGSQFYGSAINAPETGGQTVGQAANAQSIRLNKAGGYTVNTTTGQQYAFLPGMPINSQGY